MDFAPFGESTFSVRQSLHAVERRRGEVLLVRAERAALVRSLVSSARLLDGTIVTLTLVEG